MTAEPLADQELGGTGFPIGPNTKTFQIGHDPEDGFFLEVEQDLDGKLLVQIFDMIEKQFGLSVVPEDENDVVILDNGNIRIWLEPEGGVDGDH